MVSGMLNIRRLMTIIRRRYIFFFFLCIGATGIFISGDVLGQGNLLITPRRVVFEGATRTVDLNLANIGQDTAVYIISLVQIRMKEDGSFENITEPDPGQNFADRNLRYFPRTVKLPPNEAQVVKVQLFRANQLAPGEYRSHFYFRAETEKKALGEKELIDTSSISVRITPIFGITIPAIIRIGESTAKITLSDLKLDLTEEAGPTLKLRFNRTGNFSVYGDLTVDHISTQGKVTRVGIANGIAVYTPNASRLFQLPLNKVQGADFRSGTLRIIFSAPSDVKPVRYAEAELSLN